MEVTDTGKAKTMELKNTALSIIGAAALIPSHLHAEPFGVTGERRPFPRDFYGRVVDQNGNGVENAEVEVGYWGLAEWPSDSQESGKIRVQTDIRGNWHTVSPSASKDGYEFIKHYVDNPVRRRTTAEKPLVVRMKKE